MGTEWRRRGGYGLYGWGSGVDRRGGDGCHRGCGRGGRCECVVLRGRKEMKRRCIRLDFLDPCVRRFVSCQRHESAQLVPPRPRLHPRHLYPSDSRAMIIPVRCFSWCVHLSSLTTTSPPLPTPARTDSLLSTPQRKGSRRPLDTVPPPPRERPHRRVRLPSPLLLTSPSQLTRVERWDRDALDGLGLKRYCCRRMVLTHVDLIEKLLHCTSLSSLSLLA